MGLVAMCPCPTPLHPFFSKVSTVMKLRMLLIASFFDIYSPLSYISQVLSVWIQSMQCHALSGILPFEDGVYCQPFEYTPQVAPFTVHPVLGRRR